MVIGPDGGDLERRGDALALFLCGRNGNAEHDDAEGKRRDEVEGLHVLVSVAWWVADLSCLVTLRLVKSDRRSESMNRRINRMIALLAFVGVATSGCQPQVNVGLTGEDTAALRQAVQAQLLAANAGDSAGWAAWYVDDAMVLPPDGPTVHSRAAIQKWLAALPPISNAIGQADEFAGRGDLAYVRGTYSMTMTPAGAPAPLALKGKFIQIYRKQPDGSWKVAREIFNNDMPPAAPEPAVDSGR